MTELAKRLVFGFLAAPLFLAIIWYGGWLFLALIIGIGLQIQREINQMLINAGHQVNQPVVYATGLFILLFPYIPDPLLVGTALLVVLIGVETFNGKDTYVQRLSATVFSGIYAPILLLGLLLLRNTGSGETGAALALTLILAVWANDIAAYFGGRKLGRHLLAPSISPKKTWEGFFSGFAGSLLIIPVICYLYPGYPAPLLTALPIGVIVALFAPLGDLSESRFKRSCDVKDSGNVLPGHGGLFDRFDALLLSSPVAYLYVALIGGW